MIRRLVISLGIFAGLLGLADRGLAMVAAGAVASAVQRSERLAEKPDVAFRGFPFITQAVRGRFERVDITARDVRKEGLTVTSVRAELSGVQVGLSKALSGEVSAVPVDSGVGTVRLSFADVNAYLAARPGDPRLSSAGGRLRIQATVAVAGQGQVTAEGTATITVAGDVVQIRTTSVGIAGGGTLPSAAVAEARRRLTADVPLTGLPFGVKVTGVRVDAEGIEATATAEGFVIRAR